MTERSRPTVVEDLTSEDIEHLMRVARKERSIMAHKILSSFFSMISSTLKGFAVHYARRLRVLIRRGGRSFGGPAGGASAAGGASHA